MKLSVSFLNTLVANKEKLEEEYDHGIANYCIYKEEKLTHFVSNSACHNVVMREPDEGWLVQTLLLPPANRHYDEVDTAEYYEYLANESSFKDGFLVKDYSLAKTIGSLSPVDIHFAIAKGTFQLTRTPWEYLEMPHDVFASFIELSKLTSDNNLAFACAPFISADTLAPNYNFSSIHYPIHHAWSKAAMRCIRSGVFPKDKNTHFLWCNTIKSTVNGFPCDGTSIGHVISKFCLGREDLFEYRRSKFGALIFVKAKENKETVLTEFLTHMEKELA